ncbi:MAG: ATP-dependent DNA helicase RecG, partial [Bacteroidales bacterium]|nr:ATP-dependent DNA helicase RecG [Bacteroidales bacterium]
MIIYKNDVHGFRNAVDNNAIVSDIEKGFQEKFGRKVNASEKRSWNNSLRFMETALRKANIPSDCGVLLEYNIPSTSMRIDFIVTGHDDKDNANFVIVELKQWESAEATSKEDLVTTF